MANRDELLVLAAQIVSAHVANNAVVPGDVPKLIDAVYHALSKVGRSPDTAPPADPSWRHPLRRVVGCIWKSQRNTASIVLPRRMSLLRRQA